MFPQISASSPAACNRPPASAVREGKLRQDLYFRLKTFEIEIPPLRERREDLPKLIDTFLHRFSDQLRKPLPQIAPETLERLCSYPWPGNVRELQNGVEHALLPSVKDSVLSVQCLPREIRLPEPRGRAFGSQSADFGRRGEARAAGCSSSRERE